MSQGPGDSVKRHSSSQSSSCIASLAKSLTKAAVQHGRPQPNQGDPNTYLVLVNYYLEGPVCTHRLRNPYIEQRVAEIYDYELKVEISWIE